MRERLRDLLEAVPGLLHPNQSKDSQPVAALLWPRKSVPLGA